ncbi:MAG: TolC family protein [Chitinophagaceae bacterium]|nr:TolC family protein [Chitinophagaceae bacterium]
MKHFFWILILLPTVAWGQNSSALSLKKAYQLARENYPLIKQLELVKQTSSLNIGNLSKAFLPQANISGQATYQSEVTQISIPIPGVKLDPTSKDQYKILADINQLIYDGGVIKQQQHVQRLNDDVEQQKIEVELYKVKERINQVFLGVLFLDEQLKQVELIKTDLNSGIKKVTAQVNNGVAFKSNLNVLKAELLKTEQRSFELTASRKGLINVLGLFINQPLAENTQLEKPVITSAVLNTTIERPELKLYTSQEKLLQSQNKLISSKNLPKASAFVQGGYGRPGLNFLNNQFDFFYTTGLRLNWSLGGLYTKKNDRQLIEVNRKIVDVQKETFLLNTNASLKQQQAEVEKLEQLVTTDAAIIELREQVKEAAKAQLENGVISANDYLREVNAEDQARQSLITHTIQLLQAQINYQTIAGTQ